MLIDENGNYQTGRAVSKLVRIKPFIKNEKVLTLRADNLSDFDINLDELKHSKSFVKCKIWSAYFVEQLFITIYNILIIKN